MAMRISREVALEVEVGIRTSQEAAATAKTPAFHCGLG